MFSGLKEILIFVAVIILLIMFTRFKAVRIVIGIMLLFALMISGIFSYSHIDNYYSTTGGVYGEITELLNSNTIQKEEVDENIYFSFNNVVLTKDDDGYYSLNFTKDETLDLLENEQYIVYVNGFPCDIISESISADNSYIIARYNYIFYDRDINGNLIAKAEDKMQLEFDFYKNSTQLKVFIFNGDETNGLWNAYFNKNNFNVTISKIEKLYESDSQFGSVTLIHNNKVLDVYSIKKGTEFLLPELSNSTNLIFRGWTDKDNNDIDESIIVLEDIILYANFEAVETEF